MNSRAPQNCYRDEGNSGGDYIVIEKLKDGMAYIEIGHCCVMTVSKIVPVEVLTSILSKIFFEGNPKVEDIIGWSGEFKKQLLEKIKDKESFTYTRPRKRYRPLSAVIV